ncbi:MULTISPECIES: GNAT family N-acetyltransferase [unclassified Legionella]|uniref:GNAT family N-acetyltransferase n=1 Tax=unclassified Legionella TaxID=2622702 RepID=UPI001054F7CF|nr:MULTISPECIES: GNAT family N-acetyltransferase [unclassified Legionella]MDI9818331.1 GNAT family N-acetyltransferase [Legionella sp. PL877]
MNIIETERLILRTWKEEDIKIYYQINQDPRVIEFLPGSLSLEQAGDFITRMGIQFDQYGYTLWAVELKETGEMIGFTGLNYPTFKSHFTPAVEIGWRLSSLHWGKGYATEGANASLDYGFNQCGFKEIVAFTVPLNKRSIRVMEKIGMNRDLDGDFAHPKFKLDHRLSRHVLYRRQR